MTERILVVDDEQVALKRLVRLLEREGYEATGAETGDEALPLLEEARFDVVLTDLVMEGVDGLQVLEAAKKADPDVEVIVMTGYGSVDTAIEAMKRRAFHYIQKPLKSDEIKHLVDQALQKRRLGAKVMDLEQRLDAEEMGIVGHSPAIRELRALIRKVARLDSNVLITGDSGTGKELVAAAIHERSRRAGKEMIAVNCAGFTDELLGNELFGHEKEAYTGATTAREGVLEHASGGTVFFDEVGDMSPAMQAKLLRVIQQKEFLRVGGVKPVHVDVRIVAATNKNLKNAMEVGSFRQDLFFRLSVVPIHIPPLAERKEDIPALTRHFLGRVNAKLEDQVVGVTDAAMQLLCSYDFPGNVRELENIVERSASLCQGKLIDVGDLPPDLSELDVFTFKRDGGRLKSLKEIEQDYIRWVLERCGNNKTRAARALGIDRASLYRKYTRNQVKS
jgi:DNA-binding NtrC family response regulator